MQMNFLATLVAALVPMIVGFVYYHKNVIGNAWMKVTGMTEEKAKEGNMALTFIVSYVLSVLLAFALNSVVIHQNGLVSLFGGDTTNDMFKQVFEATKNDFRTFGHGALHGLITSIFVAFPILATNALFEQKGWKYIWINTGYWAITITLMGGIICAWR